jgi:hypothetical protein
VIKSLNKLSVWKSKDLYILAALFPHLLHLLVSLHHPDYTAHPLSSGQLQLPPGRPRKDQRQPLPWTLAEYILLHLLPVKQTQRLIICLVKRHVSLLRIPTRALLLQLRFGTTVGELHVDGHQLQFLFRRRRLLSRPLRELSGERNREVGVLLLNILDFEVV